MLQQRTNNEQRINTWANNICTQHTVPGLLAFLEKTMDTYNSESEKNGADTDAS